MGEIRVLTEMGETEEEDLSPLQNLFWVPLIGQRPWKPMGKDPCGEQGKVGAEI